MLSMEDNITVLMLTLTKLTGSSSSLNYMKFKFNFPGSS